VAKPKPTQRQLNDVKKTQAETETAQKNGETRQALIAKYDRFPKTSKARKELEAELSKVGGKK